MVWVRFGGRRRRRSYGGSGGFSGYGGGYGRRRGGGGCLRDLFLVETGCCLAEAMGCGPQLVLLAPAAGRLLLHRPRTPDSRAIGLVRLYQSQVSVSRAQPCCRMTPSCSTYAVTALRVHGTGRGLRLTAARLLRCRPGGTVGPDAVPPRGD